jgi:hypothetical protein
MLPISQRMCQSGKRSFTLSATDRSLGYSPLRVTDGPAQFSEFRNYFTLRLALSTQVVSFSGEGGKIAGAQGAGIFRINPAPCELRNKTPTPVGALTFKSRQAF